MTAPADLRRLLEMAAKAVGGTLSEGHTKRRTGPTWETWEWIGEPGIVMPAGYVMHPFSDDGDSRRLQVACRLQLACYDGGAHVNDGLVPSFFRDVFEGNGGDPCAAARMAVLRAAAAIGEAMP